VAEVRRPRQGLLNDAIAVADVLSDENEALLQQLSHAAGHDPTAAP
jgi:hypothetical protein